MDCLLALFSLDLSPVATSLFQKSVLLDFLHDNDAVCEQRNFSCITTLDRALSMVLKRKILKVLSFSPLTVMPVAKFSATVPFEVEKVLPGHS